MRAARFDQYGDLDVLQVREVDDLVASGAIDIPITRTHPIDRVREAHADLNNRRTQGKIVLIP